MLIGRRHIVFGSLTLSIGASDLAQRAFAILQEHGEARVNGVTELQSRLGTKHGPIVVALGELGYVRQARFQTAARAPQRQFQKLVLPKKPTREARLMYDA